MMNKPLLHSLTAHQWFHHIDISRHEATGQLKIKIKGTKYYQCKTMVYDGSILCVLICVHIDFFLKERQTFVTSRLRSWATNPSKIVAPLVKGCKYGKLASPISAPIHMQCIRKALGLLELVYAVFTSATV